MNYAVIYCRIEARRRACTEYAAAPDGKAMHLRVERIDAKGKAGFNITATLKSALGSLGAGEPDAILPEILFSFGYRGSA